PLPRGSVKAFQRDRSGSAQMLGENRIGHTPQDERISLMLGRSFDVVGERKRTSYRRHGRNSYEETFEIEIRNRKPEPETVHVVGRHYGVWRVKDPSMEFSKPDSNTLEFVLKLQAGESRKLT